MSVTKSARWRCHGLAVEVGDTLTVRGERGARFKFLAWCRDDLGREWIDCFGGRRGREAFRSFHPDRVAAVHHARL